MKSILNSYSIAVASIIAAIIVACSSSSGGGGSNGSNNNSGSEISYIENVQAVSAGASHTLVIKKNGTVWAFGANDYGQLGLGNNTNTNYAQQITNLGSDASAVAAGFNHSLVLKKDGTLWSFGNNSSGELGLKNNASSNIASKVIFSDTVVNNKVIAIAAGGIGPIIKSDNKIYYTGHSLALKKDGTVWAFGLNVRGQLGLGTIVDASEPTKIPTITGAVAVAAGSSHSLILKNDGTVWAMGNGFVGQLGLNNTADTSVPTKIPNLKDVKAIAAGDGYSLILNYDNTVWSFGNNRFGQLGLNSSEIVLKPTKIDSLAGVKAITASFSHSLALLAEGSLWTFGTIHNSQQGSNTPISTPIKVTSLDNDVSAMSAGGNFESNLFSRFSDFTIALKKDGTLWSFGTNDSGQLGLGNNDSTITPTRVKQIKSAQ